MYLLKRFLTYDELYFINMVIENKNMPKNEQLNKNYNDLFRSIATVIISIDLIFIFRFLKNSVYFLKLFIFLNNN